MLFILTVVTTTNHLPKSREFPAISCYESKYIMLFQYWHAYQTKFTTHLKIILLLFLQSQVEYQIKYLTISTNITLYLKRLIMIPKSESSKALFSFDYLLRKTCIHKVLFKIIIIYSRKKPIGFFLTFLLSFNFCFIKINSK